MSLEHFDDRRKGSDETTVQLECDISEPVLAWAAYEQLCLYARQHGLVPGSVSVTVKLEATGKPTPGMIQSLEQHLKRLGSGRVLSAQNAYYPDTPIPQQRNGL